MKDDPAARRSLSAEDIERITGYQFVQTRAPGVTPLSELEVVLFFGVVFIVSTALVIHFMFQSFLPFTVAYPYNYLLSILALVGMILGGRRLFGVLLSLMFAPIGRAMRKAFPRWPEVTCPDCTARSSLKRYSDGKGCPKCRSHSVYCAKCGKTALVTLFIEGLGCPHCGHKKISVRTT